MDERGNVRRWERSWRDGRREGEREGGREGGGREGGRKGGKKEGRKEGRRTNVQVSIFYWPPVLTIAAHDVTCLHAHGNKPVNTTSVGLSYYSQLLHYYSILEFFHAIPMQVLLLCSNYAHFENISKPLCPYNVMYIQIVTLASVSPSSSSLLLSQMVRMSLFQRVIA